MRSDTPILRPQFHFDNQNPVTNVISIAPAGIVSAVSCLQRGMGGPPVGREEEIQSAKKAKQPRGQGIRGQEFSLAFLASWRSWRFARNVEHPGVSRKRRSAEPNLHQHFFDSPHPPPPGVRIVSTSPGWRE